MVHSEQPSPATASGWASGFTRHWVRFMLTGAVPAAISGVLMLASWPAWVAAAFLMIGVVVTSYAVWADERAARIAALVERDAALYHPVSREHAEQLHQVVARLRKSVRDGRPADFGDADWREALAAHKPDIVDLVGQWDRSLHVLHGCESALRHRLANAISADIPEVGVEQLGPRLYELLLTRSREGLLGARCEFEWDISHRDSEPAPGDWVSLAWRQPGWDQDFLVNCDPSEVDGIKVGVERLVEDAQAWGEVDAVTLAIARRDAVRESAATGLGLLAKRTEFHGTCRICTPL